MINASEPVHSFTIKDDDEDSSPHMDNLKASQDTHRTIGMIFALCIGFYCFKKFWIRPVTPRDQPYSPVSF